MGDERAGSSAELGALVESRVAVGARELTIVHPRTPDDLLDEEAFEREEFLPYWAEPWPSGVALARALVGRPLRGARVVELGCGLALPSIYASLEGAHVLATDWSTDAIESAEQNAVRNGAELEMAVVRWSQPEPLLERAPWDLVLAADVLYERRNVDELLALLPRLSNRLLLADPGRPPAKRFLEAWPGELVRQDGSVTVYALQAAPRAAAC
ncbi:MAG: 50S ribosomal protein L11 methyltransferase [Gaiellaceae bacterium]